MCSSWEPREENMELSKRYSNFIYTASFKTQLLNSFAVKTKINKYEHNAMRLRQLQNTSITLQI